MAAPASRPYGLLEKDRMMSELIPVQVDPALKDVVSRISEEKFRKLLDIIAEIVAQDIMRRRKEAKDD